jgi:hypothetical protein
MSRAILLVLAIALLLPACKKPRRPPGPQEPLDLKPEQVECDIRGLGSRLHGEVMPLVLADPDSPRFMDGEPEHLRLTFDTDVLSGRVNPRERQILIYPVVSYGGLFLGVERMEFEKRVRTLVGWIKSRPATIAEPIPLFPATDIPELFHARIRYLEFGDGSGIRFVARHAREPDRQPGDSLFYAFQGVTHGGKYLVCVYYPITAPAMPPVSKPREAAGMLDSLAESSFNPDLAQLDGMVRSLRIAAAHP